jgi:hypothetical protein
MRRIIVVLGVVSAGVAAARGDTVIVPNAAAGVAGTGGYSTIMHSAARSYQLVVGPAELSTMPAGSRITGIRWRRPSWQVYPAWPSSPVTFAAFDVTLSTSNFPPGQLSRTYTENIGPDAVQVRAGPLTLPAGFFPGGALAPNINEFGSVLEFTSPYTYSGGTLLLTIRHTGNGISSGFLDTVSSPHCQAIGVSSYTQPDEWYNQGPIVMQLVFEPPNPCLADWNGDGVVDFNDFLAFLNDYNTGDPRADLNGDGTVDFNDFLEFLNHYNTPCP